MEYEMSDKGRGAGGRAVIMSDNQRIETDTFSHWIFRNKG